MLGQWLWLTLTTSFQSAQELDVSFFKPFETLTRNQGLCKPTTFGQLREAHFLS